MRIGMPKALRRWRAVAPVISLLTPRCPPAPHTVLLLRWILQDAAQHSQKGASPRPPAPAAVTTCPSWHFFPPPKPHVAERSLPQDGVKALWRGTSHSLVMVRTARRTPGFPRCGESRTSLLFFLTTPVSATLAPHLQAVPTVALYMPLYDALNQRITDAGAPAVAPLLAGSLSRAVAVLALGAPPSGLSSLARRRASRPAAQRSASRAHHCAPNEPPRGVARPLSSASLTQPDSLSPLRALNRPRRARPDARPRRRRRAHDVHLRRAPVPHGRGAPGAPPAVPPGLGRLNLRPGAAPAAEPPRRPLRVGRGAVAAQGRVGQGPARPPPVARGRGAAGPGRAVQRTLLVDGGAHQARAAGGVGGPGAAPPRLFALLPI